MRLRYSRPLTLPHYLHTALVVAVVNCLTLLLTLLPNGPTTVEIDKITALLCEMTLVGSVPRSTKMSRQDAEDALILQAFPPPFSTARMMTKMMTMMKMMKKKKPDAATAPKIKFKSKFETDTDDATDTDTADTDEEGEDEDKTKKKTTKKKKTEYEDPDPQDPDNDIGVSPIETNPGDPKEEGNSFHPSSPTAPHLQGPFPGG